MPSITITSVTFTQTPIAPMVINFYYKTGAGVFIDAPGNPHTVPVNGILSVPIIINGLSYNTTYTVSAVPECGGGEGAFEKDIDTVDCTCPTTYTKSEHGDWCEKVEVVAPTITHSNWCLAISRNAIYSSVFTRIYNPNFSSYTIKQQTPSIPGDVYAQLTLTPYWKNNNNINNGPFNRVGVWLDSDCNGIKNSLEADSKTTIGYAYLNTAGPRTIHVGIAGDNQFELIVNGQIVAATTGSDASHSMNWKIWHIFPIDLQDGWNDINAIATGDGSINDAIGMIVYNNSASEIVAATSDGDLDILFTTETLVGQHVDTSTCEAGYSLVMGAHGTYYCRKITTVPCGTPDP